MVLLAALAWLAGQGVLVPEGDAQARDVRSERAPLKGNATDPKADKSSADAGTSRYSLENPAARALAPEVILAGRCLDEEATPLAGVEIALTVAEGTPGYALDLYRFRHPHMVWDDPPIVVQSREDGKFELRLRTPPVYRGWRLQIRVDGRVPLEQLFDELTAGRHELGDIQLRRGCLLTGAVRDGQGRPHAGVRVFLSRLVDWNQTVVEQNFLVLRSSADGTFRAPAHLAPAQWKVNVHEAQLLEEKPLLVDLSGKTSHDLQIRVRNFEEVSEITGWVLDEAGRPLTPSWIHFEPSGDYSSTCWSETDKHGRFLVQRRQRDPEGKITLIVTGRGRPTHRVPGVAWNTKGLRIVVPQPPALELTVREAETGRPVEHYGVIHQQSRRMLDFGVLSPLSHIEQHPGGRVRINGLSCGRHRFTVVPRDPALAWSEPRDIEVGEEPPTPLVFALPRRGARSVAVVDASGHPVAGVKLQLLRPGFAGRKQRLFIIDPLDTSGASGPALALLEREVLTDSDGQQVLGGNPTHGYLLRVLHATHLPQLLWEVVPDARFGELRIVLDRGCVVHGRVEPLELWKRFLSHRPAPGEGRETPGIGFSVQSLVPESVRRASSLVLPDPSGHFVIQGVPPGAAELSMSWYRRDRENLDREVTTVHRWSELPVDRPAEIVVDLRRLQPVQVEGLVTCNGRPMPDTPITVSVVQELGAVRKIVQGFQVRTDADGRFVCETLTGNWEAYWFPGVEEPFSPSLVVQAGSVTAQTRAMNLAFRSGALNLVLQDDEQTPLAGVVVYATPKDHKGRIHRLPPSDARGGAGLPHMAPGEYHLWTWPRLLASRAARRKVFGDDADAAEKARIFLGTIEVVMGKAVERRLALPETAGY